MFPLNFNSSVLSSDLPGMRKTSPIMMRLRTMRIDAVGSVVKRSNFQPVGVTVDDVE